MFVSVAMTVNYGAVLVEMLMFVDVGMGMFVGMGLLGCQLLPPPQE